MTLRPLPVGLGAAMISVLSACGTVDPSYDAASRDAQGLECVSNCQGGVFYRGGQLLPFNNIDLDGGHTMAPAICATPSNGFVAVSVDTSHQYRVLQFNANTRGPSWDVYDSGYTWNSKPSCAQIESTTFNGQPGFIVVGKGSDNTLHNADGQMAPGAYPQANPEQIEIDEQISTTTYSAGSPGVASSQDSSGNGLVVVAIVDDRQTLYAYTKPFPVLWEYWSSAIKGPKLPLGWSAIGAPAIASEPNNKWAIVVHARNGSSVDAIFRTVLTAPYSGTPSFSLSWTRLGGTITGEMDDDPALTWDSTLATETLFIRQGNATIYQSSGNPPGAHPLDPISLSTWDWIASGPAAAADPFDMGNYAVLARGFDGHIYDAEAIQEPNLKP
jgi:hypothetical protein